MNFSGLALLQCHENEHARLVSCVPSGESPTGFGFGKAALAPADLSRDNVEVKETPRAAGGLVQFSFRLNPPSIEPNTLLPLTTPLSDTAPYYR